MAVQKTFDDQNGGEEGEENKTWHKIRQEEKEKVEEAIRKAVKMKEVDLNDAKQKRQTTRMWQMLVTAIEKGFISYFDMDQKSAKGMMGEANTAGPKNL